MLGGIATLSICDIIETRNVFLSMFYQTDATHLLFIDADMQFSSSMIMDMLDLDKPVVGAIYPAKVWPPTFVGCPLGKPPFDIVKGHVEVSAVGGGILLIRRDAVDKLIKEYPELIEPVSKAFITHDICQGANLTEVFCPFTPVEHDGYTRSEDLSFCFRWRAIGGEIWANVAYDIGHTGPQTFKTRFLEIAAGTPMPANLPA